MREIKLTVHPQFEEQPDGSVKAWYPDHGWTVTAPTQKEALAALLAEDAIRHQDPQYIAFLTDLVGRQGMEIW